MASWRRQTISCSLLSRILWVLDSFSEAFAQTTPSSSPTYTWHYNHSSIVLRNVDISHNSSGSAYAYACEAASATYNNFFATQTGPILPTYVSSYLTTTGLWDVWTTDCDGIPHARGTTPTSISTLWTTTTYTDFNLGLLTSFTGTTPTCYIQPTDCASLQESYSKESSALSVFTSSLVPPYALVNIPFSPQCTTACTAAPLCMIKGDEVRLIYWPVTTTGADSCRQHGTTVTPNVTTIESFVSLGTTFVSPSAYISFRSLWAWDWACQTTIGRPVSDTILAVDPKSLSSARGWHLGRSAVSFNLADLNGFVSSAAFFQQQSYDWFPRNTIYDELYNPIIWMPDEVLSWRPEWKNCGLSIFGIVDPPLALHTAEFLTQTDPPFTSVSTASPAPSMPGWLPTATPTAQGEQEGTSGWLPSSSSRDPEASATHSSEHRTGIETWTEPQTNTPLAGPSSLSRTAGPEGSHSTSADPSSLSRAAGPEGSHSTSADPPPGGNKPATDSDQSSSHHSSMITAFPGGAASIASQGVVYGGTTVAFSSVDAHPASYQDAWYAVTRDSSGSSYALVAGSTMFIAGSAVVIQGHTISARPAGIVIDGSRTISFATGSEPIYTSGVVHTVSDTDRVSPSYTSVSETSSARRGTTTLEVADGHSLGSQNGAHIVHIICCLLIIMIVTIAT